MTEPALELSLPALAENVIVVRQAVAGLGEALGLPDQRVDDLKTVVSEACNNVVVHAYQGEPGPLELTASSSADDLEVTVSDRGQGFQPRADAGQGSLGLGLPLIASLSDGFEIRGGAGQGTETKVRFSLTGAANEPHPNGGAPRSEGLAMEMMPGETVRPVLARVIGALAARAEFSVERLSDTMLLGDAVSAHPADDFSGGRVTISIRDGDGTLDVRVGPLIEGGGERVLAEMDIPGGEGSLRGLARSMEVTKGETGDGEIAEFLVIEVSS
ncbi:MAG: ATP-binding protein [Actinomycetota bacterium]|nr:ATP-binding protein [Actinomycetota bacterium]